MDERLMNVEGLKCMVDLHLHLDGAISLESAKELAKLQDISIPESDEEILKLLRVSQGCRDLNEFLEKFEFPCSLLKTKIGVETAAYNLCRELKEQGVMYAEIRFAPQLSEGNGISAEDAVVAAIEGMRKSGLKSNLILCCMRGKGLYEKNIKTIELAAKYLNKGVVLADLAGAEGVFATADFEDIFKKARELEVPFTIHAGEAAGAESVWKALEFGAVRIGHGIRSVEDKSLIEELAKRKIPLEICPTSNLQTRVYENLSEYPLREMMKNGVFITINTDDPSVEGTDIKREYNNLIKEFKLNRMEIKELLINAVKASRTSEEEKAEMESEIEKEIEKEN